MNSEDRSVDRLFEMAQQQYRKYDVQKLQARSKQANLKFEDQIVPDITRTEATCPQSIFDCGKSAQLGRFSGVKSQAHCTTTIQLHLHSQALL